MSRVKLDGEFRCFIETACAECVIDVHGLQDDGRAMLFVTTLSNHLVRWRDSWRGRFNLALLALEGRPIPIIELNDAEETDEFIAALTAARARLWPGPSASS